MATKEERQDPLREVEQTSARLLRQVAAPGRMRPEDLSSLLGGAERRSYAKGEVISATRREENRLCVLVDGAVRVCMLSSEGRELTLGYRRRCGDVFEIGVIGDGIADSVFATVLQDETVVYLLREDQVDASLASSSAAAAPLLLALRKRAREERTVLSEQALYSVPERIKSVLKRYASEDEEHVVRFTLQELAQLAGTTLPRVSTAVVELERQGLVRRRGHGQIEVPHPEDLTS